MIKYVFLQSAKTLLFVQIQVRSLQLELAKKAEQLAESERERMKMLDLEEQLAELRQITDGLEQVCCHCKHIHTSSSGYLLCDRSNGKPMH